VCFGTCFTLRRIPSTNLSRCSTKSNSYASLSRLDPSFVARKMRWSNNHMLVYAKRPWTSSIS